MMSTSARTPSSAPATTILPMRGSTGIFASTRPRSVRRYSSSSAPISVSVSYPSRTDAGRGGSSSGKSSIVPNRSVAICRMTPARLLR